MSILTITDLKNSSSDVIEEYKKKVTILGDLDRYMQWMHESKTPLNVLPFKIGSGPRPLGVHPSSVSKVGACPLAIYYECTGDVEKMEYFDMDRIDTFDLGTAKHRTLQSQLKDMYGEQFQDEVPLKDPELLMTGSADGLVTFSDIKFMLEIKTIKEGGSVGFEKVQAKPLPDHRRQVTLYMKMGNIPFGLILYYNKNTSAKKEHVVVYDPLIWEEMKVFITPVVAAVNKRTPPEGKIGQHCKYCGFYRGCPGGKEHERGSVRPR